MLKYTSFIHAWCYKEKTCCSCDSATNQTSLIYCKLETGTLGNKSETQTPRINSFKKGIVTVIVMVVFQLVHASLHAFIVIWSTREAWRVRKMRNSCSRHSQEQLLLLECFPNFPSSSYLDERTADAWTNCFNIFNAEVWRRRFSAWLMGISVKRAIEFDYTNLLALL